VAKAREATDVLKGGDMKRSLMGIWLGAALVCWFLSGAASAQQERVNAQGLAYVTGGVGLDEREAMTQMAGRYNLRLEFAQQNRDYLGEIAVRLTGPATFEAVSDGPWLMVKLPPGEYGLTAVSGGVSKSETVSVPNAGLKTLVLHW
jgi:hypothetical protein